MSVDIHGHITSPELLAAYPMPPVLGDLDAALGARREAGITTTIVGSPVGAGTMIPRPGAADRQRDDIALERYHDWLGEQVRTHPGELYGYAFADPFGDHAHLERLRARLVQPEFVAVIVNSSVHGRLLGSPAALDFWSLVHELDVPVLVHPPAEPVACAAVPDLGLLESVARPGDVALAVASMVLGGLFERFVGLKVIAAGTGAGLALLADKLDIAGANPRPNPVFQDLPHHREGTGRPSDGLRRIMVDTGNSGPLALSSALSFFGPRQVLLGTDSPPMTESLVQVCRRVEQAAGDAARGVLGENAARVFGLPVLEGVGAR